MSVELFSMLLIFPMPVILVCLCVPSTADVTCTIPSVGKGCATRLTCDFNMDMLHKKNDIVVKYKNGSTNEQKNVLFCYWGDTHYQCELYITKFTFNNSISWNLTLQLTKAMEEDEGEYYCYILPEKSVPESSCSFSLEPDPMVASSEDYEAKECFSDGLSAGDKDDEGGSTVATTGAVIGGVIGGVTGVAFVFVVVVRYRLMARCSKTESTVLNDKDDVERESLSTATIYKGKPAREKVVNGHQGEGEGGGDQNLMV